MESNKKIFDVFPEQLRRNPALARFKLKFPGGMMLGIILIIIIVILYNSFLTYVEPNEYGIKQVEIGMNRGIQKEPYTTGLHFIIPGMQKMHFLPRDIQVLELTNYAETASRFARQERAAHIQTNDGFFVDVDLSILYHIEDPYKVFTKIGPGNMFEDNGIIPLAEAKLKETLGKLTTEEFYNSIMRTQKAEEAKIRLNQEINDKGIKVDQVLVRYFKYSEEIQKNIEEKKLKDQLVFKNQAEARAAIEEAKLKKITQEGMVTVSVELEKGKAYVTKTRAEKDLYFRKKTADADLLVKLAEAEKTRLKNEALKGKGCLLYT
ncbi:MAG: SPFH domain-containing protein, partial [Methanosarcina sp.]|nr:SPFH domain-containing protein [Methanosarcina sp.]